MVLFIGSSGGDAGWFEAFGLRLLLVRSDHRAGRERPRSCASPASDLELKCARVSETRVMKSSVFLASGRVRLSLRLIGVWRKRGLEVMTPSLSLPNKGED
jgi:hypothetical protein